MGLIALMVVGVLSAKGVCAEGPKTTCDETRRLQLARANIVVVDARLSADFTQGHIQGAVNAPSGELMTNTLPRDGRIIVYCPETSCSLADTAAQKLRGIGYSNVAVLEGGLAEWVRKGYPLESGQTPAGPRAKPGRISADSARKKIAASELVVVDVRSNLEFSAGHLPGARNLPLESFAAESAGLPKDKDVLVYDRQASRSRQAATMLIESGYRVFELPGGLAGWLKKKFPLEVK